MIKKVVVLGGGISGLGAAILAKKNHFNVFLSDNKEIIEEHKTILHKHQITYEENNHNWDVISKANEVIKSPGISDKIDIVQKIISQGIPVISEIEFAYRYTNAKIAAITGSNGKTTTTLLLHHILIRAGYDVLMAGNIGISLSAAIAERDYDYIVLEISSFQLDNIVSFRPEIAILLNITADHLNRYDYQIDKYKSSKFRITKYQINSDFLIYNIDDPLVKGIQTLAKKIPLSLNRKNQNGGYVINNEIIINLNNKTMKIQELALQGKHNVFNSMAAAMAARVFEVEDSVIRQSMIDFQNIEHRLEYVITVHGIDFINDSKATNVNASWFALESMTKDIIWIVGGVDKGNDYSDLLTIAEEKVKAIICLGVNNKNIIDSFKGKVDVIIEALNMHEAVRKSYSLANTGDVVLLSPACASFDLFVNYEERGLQFKQEVRKL